LSNIEVVKTDRSLRSYNVIVTITQAFVDRAIDSDLGPLADTNMDAFAAGFSGRI